MEKSNPIEEYIIDPEEVAQWADPLNFKCRQCGTKPLWVVKGQFPLLSAKVDDYHYLFVCPNCNCHFSRWAPDLEMACRHAEMPSSVISHLALRGKWWRGGGY